MQTKKLILLIFSVLIILQTQAQIQKESWLISGSTSMSVSSLSNNGVNRTDIFISGRAGYFFTDNVAAGAFLSYNRNGGNGFSTTSFSIGPQIRYYFPESAFIGTSIAYTQIQSESDLFNGQSDSGQISFELGYPILVKDVVAFEPALVYSLDTNTTNDLSTFGLFVGIALYFGN